MEKIKVIGAGLAGSEVALFLADRGIDVELIDMKPNKYTPAHSSKNFGELVCSNSFRGLHNAVGVLKNELNILKSPIFEIAKKNSIPAGNALAVDRDLFSKEITNRLTQHEHINILSKEIESIEFNNSPIVIATGPLTTEPLSNFITSILKGDDGLYFYDAIAPIIDGSTIDYNKVFRASRWDKGESEEGDYINCPMNYDQYIEFITELKKAEKVSLHHFESEKYFSGCLPIEVILERGEDSLRFGPMKPIGLINKNDPEKKYYAVIQLRAEDKNGEFYNMVGFQTKLTYKEQKRVFSKIPGLENVKFERYGSIHRNSYIDAPKNFNNDLSIKGYPDLYITGQLSGVEGYVESIAMGTLTAISIYSKLKKIELKFPNNNSAMGALIEHLLNSNGKKFQPSNINFSLFKELEKRYKGGKRVRNQVRVERAEKYISEYYNQFFKDRYIY